MKYRRGEHGDAEFDEQKEVEALESMLAASGIQEPHDPSDAYWSRLLVGTNRRIDEATSGKAISIAWAARVAIPGVVAIISFLIGIYYYVPEPGRHEPALSTVVSALPEDALDSLLTEHASFDGLATSIVSDHEISDLSQEQIADYLIINGRTDTVLESLSDQQVDELIVTLDALRD